MCVTHEVLEEKSLHMVIFTITSKSNMFWNVKVGVLCLAFLLEDKDFPFKKKPLLFIYLFCYMGIAS